MKSRFGFVPVKAILLFSAFTLALSVAFTNCSAPKDSTVSSSSSGTSVCAGYNASPRTISDTVQLINSLPKPVTMECFLQSLAKPMQVFAVNNAFSAQPSGGQDNPRVFIIFPGFVLSAVPTGPGSTFIEMSELLSGSSSVKAEIEFPITGTLAADAPFTRILNPSNSSSSRCTFCHSGEVMLTAGSYPGPAFVSSIVRPDTAKRIVSPYLKVQSRACNKSADPYRCSILKAIFEDGKAQDANFP